MQSPKPAFADGLLLRTTWDAARQNVRLPVTLNALDFHVLTDVSPIARAEFGVELAEPAAHDVRIVGRRPRVVFGCRGRVISHKQRKLVAFVVSRVKEGRPLPTVRLIFRQRAQMGDDLLPRTPLGSSRLDQGEIGLPFAILGALILAQEHPRLHSKCDTDSTPGKEVGPHYNGI